MNRRSCLSAAALGGLVILALQGPAIAGKVRVEGFGFSINKLDEGVDAFANRPYVLREVPEAIRGWQFTRLPGGVRCAIEATPSEDGDVTIITSAKQAGVRLEGWEEIPSGSFHYTAKEKTRLQLFRRKAVAGQPVTIPQGNWTGCMVAAPQLEAVVRAAAVDHSRVPGVVIDHIPASTRCYVGSPSIAILPGGDYVASHDIFGPGSTNDLTVVFRSADRGRTWEKLGEIRGQWWSTLFVHRGLLYIIGPNRQDRHVGIRRSQDGGRTWTTPADKQSGLLRDDGKYHCAPMPVIEHAGRLWRAMEDAQGPGGWGSHFRALMMSVPADADLLVAANWTFSNAVGRDPAWLDGQFNGWLEGNAVVDRNGRVLAILRVDTPGYPEKAALVASSPDGRTATFDPTTGFIDFPGGAKKFTIRFEPESRLYWTLATAVRKEDQGARKPGGVRNTLVLMASPDLRSWTIRKTLLHHPEIVFHGFQYVDWVFDGPDIIAACRTAYDDGLGGAHNNHDANYLTFHRIEGFRTAQDAR